MFGFCTPAVTTQQWSQTFQNWFWKEYTELEGSGMVHYRGHAWTRCSKFRSGPAGITPGAFWWHLVELLLFIQILAAYIYTPACWFDASSSAKRSIQMYN